VIKRIRDAALVVGGLLTAVGVVPAEVVQVVSDAIEPIAGGIVAAVGVVNFVRAYRAKRAADAAAE